MDISSIACIVGNTKLRDDIVSAYGAIFENANDPKLSVDIEEQRDGISCGGTSLSAVYDYYDQNRDTDETVDEVERASSGGTMDVCIGTAALKRGFKVTIHTCSPRIIDRTWKDIDSKEMVKKLKLMLKDAKADMRWPIERTVEFIENGGRILPDDINETLIRGYLERGVPLIAGLNCTYLYDCEREYTGKNDEAVMSDTKGRPTGHFVVISGIDGDKCIVEDPVSDNGISGTNHYKVPLEHLIKSVYLGALTNEGSITAIEI